MSGQMFRRSAVVWCVLLVAAAAAFAQDWAGRGRLQGQVTDDNGAPIAGATVTLRPAKTPDSGPKPLTTDKSGRWSILGLTGGPWTVGVAAPGYVGMEGGVNVNEFGLNPPLNMQLRKDVVGEANKKMQQAHSDFETGNALLQERKWSEARARFEHALTLVDPKDAENQFVIRRTIGYTLLQDQRYPEALEKLQAAAALNPNDAETAGFIARTHAGMGQKDQAIEVLKAFATAHPADLNTPQILADLYVETGHPDDAIATLKSFVDTHPDQLEASQRLIGLLVLAGKTDEANAYKAKLPAGTKIDPTTLLNEGIKQYNEKKFQDAAATFDRVVADNPSMADAYYYRGLANLALNKKPEAKADFNKVLELAPNGPNAKDCREFLKWL